ncbi:oxoglutarate iron-dependent oxygenase protein [Colletotrichum incanum]|uniref:Oxoglutarate iron-dependent oxygenase protein n=1 Tax=Colletotrichum incanum TaxID=1573173 RepID=A0A162NV51_COLIC|nr:oxoglutarate iron-dependent oxygenase protein [Colletotrichum incanum]OHX00626.1 oxoglutarate Iron-dependent oxygenase protein [Colletotrichum incanum]
MTATNSALAAPLGSPPVWAENRQALCDALPYFKAHEGSLYTKDKIIKGMLLNAFSSARDYLGTEVIITTLGGGRERDSQGDMVRVKPARPFVLESCHTALESGTPIGIILGKCYPGLSVEIKHAFNVLAFFTITDMWSEKDDRSFDIHKIRLERTDRSEPSWWRFMPEVQNSTELREFPAFRAKCSKCRNSSKQVFTQSWTCLNAECEECFVFPVAVDILKLTVASNHASSLAWCVDCHQGSKAVFSCGWACLNQRCVNFFTFAAGVDVNHLKYSEDFLLERTSHQVPKQPLQPPLPDTAIPGFLGTEKAMRDGIVCPECHRCARRMDWTKWAYEDPLCGFTLLAPPLPFPLANVHAEEDQQRRKRAFESRVFGDHILETSSEVNGYSIEQYLLPDPLDTDVIIGSVTVFRASRAINARAGAPDQMWDLLQHDTARDFGFQRKPVIHPGLPTEKLTRNFLQNWGAPYKFAVNVHSRPFSEAPDSVIGALKRMQWAGHTSVDMTNNAMDAYAQMPDYSKMARCDTLTEDFVDFNELLSIGYMEEDKISYHDDGEETLGPTVATLSLGSPALMSFKKKKAYAGNEKKVLQLTMFHGDLVVMHGTRIHQAYLHKVVPKGKRRFALTCRKILLENIEDDVRAEAVQNSILPEVSEPWNYPKAKDSDCRETNSHTSKRAGHESQSTTSRATKRRKSKA